MNKTSKYIIQAILIAIVVTGCIYSGRVEYTDDILSGMSLESTNTSMIVSRRLPGAEVAQEYMENKKFYDSKQY